MGGRLLSRACELEVATDHRGQRSHDHDAALPMAWVALIGSSTKMAAPIIDDWEVRPALP